MKILLYCQHLLGMGHYVRSMALAAGLSEHTVFFINGGVAIPDIAVPKNVSMVQLPPIASDVNFKLAETPSLEEIQHLRKQALLRLYDEVQPDVILVELFPFGRKKFAFELIPLLEANVNNTNRAQVMCSVRDILVKKKDQAKFEERVCLLVNRYFDSILVHSDSRVHSLDGSFSRLTDLQASIYYTGYVVPQKGNGSIKSSPSNGTSQLTKVTVSAGGGRVGMPLLETAIQAKKYLDQIMPVELTIVTGPFLPETERQRLDVLAADDRNITIETFVPNLCAVLKQSHTSVSMAGYNTCLDVLQARVPSVLVPFNGGGNDEQIRRARSLAEKGVATLLHPEDLNPENLALAIKSAAYLETNSFEINLSGVPNTRGFIEQTCQLTV
ncbi:MAG: glycosyltransferase family protein [bacterium]